MEANLKGFLAQISKEKDLDEEIIKAAIEQAIISAAHKNLSPYRNPRPVLDLETGRLKVYVIKSVVEQVENDRREISLRQARKIKPRCQMGDELEVEIEPSEFGRIAAQSVRQGIFQRLKEAERSKAYLEFKDKEGQLVNGQVQRFERGNMIINLGKTEGLLPRSEISPGARHRIGDRIKAYVCEVRPVSKGPMIRLSRTHPELVIKLFENEVPEIAEGVVKIMAIAREPGVRSKIAVKSDSKEIDPVGACVGMKGSRVQLIVSELENEKIDIIPYSDDPVQFITNALNPAKVLKVSIDEESKEAEVIVSGDTLSVAIGKKGQNAKLAARLTGWRIDIKSEEKEVLTLEDVELQYLQDFLSQIEGLIPEVANNIIDSPFNSVKKIAQAEPNELSEQLEIPAPLAQQLIEGAREYMEALEEMLAEQAKQDTGSSGKVSTPDNKAEPANQVEENQHDTPDNHPQASSGVNSGEDKD